MAKKKSKKPRRSERLQTQASYKVSRAMYPTKEAAAAAVRDARRAFLRDGVEIPGVHTVIRWRNPDNKNPAHADWKTSDDERQSLQDAFNTLHGGRGALRGMQGRQESLPFDVAPRVADEASRSSKAKRGWETRRIKAARSADVSRRRSAALRRYHANVRALLNRSSGLSYLEARRIYKQTGDLFQ